MTLFHWSQIAANNGTADVTCEFPEGMSPAAINDGTRGMMAAVAKYRDDNAGGIVTTGTLTSYVVSSFQGFDNTTDMDGKTIAFSPHVTNGDTVLLEVDGLGIFPLRSAPGVELLAGTIVQGTPYAALFNKTAGEFYLKGSPVSPFNVPFLGGLDYWDTVSPGSCFIFPNGQAISRTVYAKAFARWGVMFGPGDGATTFNAPDKTGRVSAMIESAATRLTAGFFGGNSTLLGASGGLQSNNVVLTHQHGVFLHDPGHTHAHNANIDQQNGGPGPEGNVNPAQGAATINSATTGMTIGSSAGASDNQTAVPAGAAAAHNIVQPTICCNYIIRIF